MLSCDRIHQLKTLIGARFLRQPVNYCITQMITDCIFSIRKANTRTMLTIYKQYSFSNLYSNFHTCVVMHTIGNRPRFPSVTTEVATFITCLAIRYFLTRTALQFVLYKYIIILISLI